MQLNDKKAIVTGVSKGIGLSTTRALLDAGVTVAGWSRQQPDIEHENFHFIKCDVSKAEQIEEAFSKSLDILGNRIGIVVNNAGLGYFRPMEHQSEEEWHQMFDVNVHAIFRICKDVVPLMKLQKEGHIINLGSIASTNGVPEATGYCATKFAVRGFSQALYREVKKHNIKVTCIMPGSVNTHFFDEVETTNANDTMLNPDDIATTIVELLNKPDNYVLTELEIRPINPTYS